MHDETTPVVEEVVENESKLSKIKRTAAIAGFYGITGGVTFGSMYYSYKIIKMNYEAAKLNLESAQNAAVEA